MERGFSTLFKIFSGTVMTFACNFLGVQAQDMSIPKVYSNITYNQDGQMGIRSESGNFWPLKNPEPEYTLSQMRDKIKGTKSGLAFNFQNSDLSGTLFYGFIDQNTWRYPLPVFFKKTAAIENGEAAINIRDDFSGKYDMVGWQASNKGTLGYRVINSKGKMLYEGKVTFGFSESNGFYRDTGIMEGPMLQKVSEEGVTVMFKTDFPANPKVMVKGKAFSGKGNSKYHEIQIKGLSPGKSYTYQVQIGDISREYEFRTAPKKGTQKAFTFAYASDSRAGQGGGERNIKGTNAYIMKRIGALANQENAQFLQFTGDLINGYGTNRSSMNLEYANWKRALDPFTHEIPIFVGFGNHEAFLHRFDNGSLYGVTVDKFPFDRNSAETLFSDHFANPENGPESEDGTYYDPQKGEKNFPDYKETAFHYHYGNVAMIVLNSNYWFAPSLEQHPVSGGNLHGYIMDKQLAWLKETLKKYQQDKGIDHIFLTLHTPFFPNGGHVDDDMWYNGQNGPRPHVNGKAVKQGIIERRDEMLKLLVNKHEKVRAIITGDEHNYNRLPIHQKMERYPDPYKPDKLPLKDTLWQINNGAAGAPYYAQEPTPWQDEVKNFTTQNALVLFHVNGESIKVEVINPVTLEVFDEFTLR